MVEMMVMDLVVSGPSPGDYLHSVFRGARTNYRPGIFHHHIHHPPEAMQDLPPIGGYDPVQWKRNLPSRGFRATVYFWGITGLIGFGFYRLYKGVQEQNELMRERQWSRFHLEPLLLAEQDRNIARRYYAEQRRRELVKELMLPEARAEFEEPLYHDKSKTRLPKYVAGAPPSEQ